MKVMPTKKGEECWNRGTCEVAAAVVVVVRGCRDSLERTMAVAYERRVEARSRKLEVGSHHTRYMRGNHPSWRSHREDKSWFPVAVAA